MTSSFTSLLLAAALAFGVVPRPGGARTALLARLAQQVVPGLEPELRALAASAFERVVYLGSRELKGLAREAALKMLELTDGRVVALGEAPLGFRHGPKTIVCGRTLVVVFVSGDPYTRRYDLDLVSELRREGIAARVVTLSGGLDSAHADDLSLAAEERAAPVTDLELCFPFAMFAQALAMLRSLSLGIRPDKPNAAGTVNRVVQGVSIHPYAGLP
jgi:tagatose-6-phosphate ketose/aldose isomerase